MEPVLWYLHFNGCGDKYPFLGLLEPSHELKWGAKTGSKGLVHGVRSQQSMYVSHSFPLPMGRMIAQISFFPSSLKQAPM